MIADRRLADIASIANVGLAPSASIQTAHSGARVIAEMPDTRNVPLCGNNSPLLHAGDALPQARPGRLLRLLTASCPSKSNNNARSRAC